MRPRPVVATAALTAVLALVALPGLVGSRTPSPFPSPEAAAFQAVLVRASDRTALPIGPLDAAHRGVDALAVDSILVEPPEAPGGATAALVRPDVAQPSGRLGVAVKPPRYTLHGYASFYDNGTTAMRLPRGTRIRICGNGGCVDRVVNDYGPSSRIRPVRIVDMYRPDFFAICGCGSWSGTTYVSVAIY